MKAMRVIQPGKIEGHSLAFEEVTVPKPEAGEVLIKINVCGVCHTDLHVAEGDVKAARYPITPGHQVVGIVEELGAGVTKVNVGDRVGVPWLFSTCGHCDACQRGDENLCENAKFTGKDVDGGFAEFMIAKADFILRIPSLFSDVQAAPLLCAGIVGYRSVKVAGVQPGEKIGLVGFGASGHLVLQYLNSMKCKTYVFTRAENHRQHARELGAFWAGGIEEDLGTFLDRIIIFAPAGNLVQPSLGKVRTAGVVATNAVYMTPIPEMEYKWLYGERVLRSVANATREDGTEFLAAAEKYGIKTTTSVYPLADANQALKDLKTGKIVGEAILVMR